jgi:benzoate membrane transport protein
MVENAKERLPAVITFLIASSGISFFQVGAAFWAILVGLIVIALLNLKRPFGSKA